MNSTTSYTERWPQQAHQPFWNRQNYSRTDGKRPDGLTLIPRQRGKSVTWDVTDTVADTYLHLTSAKGGGAAENAATRKEDKHVDLQQTYTFIPLSFETFGPINVKGVEFLKSWAAASQPSATTTVRLHSCSSESPSRCSGSTLSRSWHICVNSWARDSVLMTLQGQRTPLSFRFPFAFDFRSVRFSLYLFYFFE